MVIQDNLDFAAMRLEVDTECIAHEGDRAEGYASLETTAA